MLALITAAAARPLDEDLQPLTVALAARGIAHQIVDWDDPTVDWRRFDAAVIRSTWDYIDPYAARCAWPWLCRSQQLELLVGEAVARVRWKPGP